MLSGPAELVVTISAPRVVVGDRLTHPLPAATPAGSEAANASGGVAGGLEEDDDAAAAAAAAAGDELGGAYTQPREDPDSYFAGPGVGARRTACQTWALVVTGNLASAPGAAIPLTTSPAPLTPGICGRAPATAPDASAGLSRAEWVAIIVAAAVAGAVCLALSALLFLRERTKRRLAAEHARAKAPPGAALMTVVEAHSVAHSGPLAASEQVPGYAVGTLGYVPAGHAHDPLLLDQDARHALKMAQTRHGRLSRAGLAARGIGEEAQGWLRV